MVKYVINRIFTGNFFLCIVLMFAYMLFVFGGMTGKADMSGNEAYMLYMNSGSNLTYVILTLLLALDYPLHGSKQNIVMRTGWKRWLIYEMVSLVTAEILFSIAILLIAFLLFPDAGGSWSLDFCISFFSDGSAFSFNLATVGNMTGWVLYSSVYKAAFFTFAAHTLLGIICGLVCFLFNMGNKKMYAAFVLFFVNYAPDIINEMLLYSGNMQKAQKLSYFDIFEISRISYMKMNCFGGYILPSQVLVWFLLIIVILVQIIMLRRRVCLR